MHRFLKTVLTAAIVFFTLYLCSYIVQYGIMILMCVILLVMGSLMYVHIEGASSREVLWSLSRRQRQLFHAKNVPYFSVVPINNSVPVEDDLQGVPKFRPWNEWRWRKLCETTGEKMSKEIYAGREYVKEVDNYLVRSGWPTNEEVDRCDNTIVLTVRESWAGLAARVNPVLNACLNKYLKCWNRSLVWTTVRLSSYGLPYPAVSIDFPTADVATLNFGQKDDCLVMSYIYDQVRRTYPKAKIILLSVCLGGLRILNWLSRNPNPANLVGVVLESPLPSVRHLIQGFLGSYFNDDLYQTFCMIVPNFRPELDSQYSFLRPLSVRGDAHDTMQICQIPIFIGMIDSDTFSNRAHLPLFIHRFPNLSVFHTNDETLTHGKLYRLPEYRAAVQTFLTVLQQQPNIQQIRNLDKPKSIPVN